MLTYRGGALAADPTRESALESDPDETLASLRGTNVVRTADVLAGDLSPARWIVAHSLAPRRALLAEIDRGLLVAALLAAAGTIALAFHLAARVTRPLERLAVQAERIDLDRLDTRFPSDRADEVGSLSALLNQMTGRLRTSVAKLRDAERRATLGDVARQVNHDLRNGIAPLRNVVRHLSDVADRSPDELAALYRERHATIDSSLSYLDDLAKSYARLSPHPSLESCDLASIVRDVAATRNAEDASLVHVHRSGTVPPVSADPVGLRRVVDNLVSNAIQALRPGGRVELELLADADEVVLRVRDDGAGIPQAELDRIFDHFYTTKPTGTGLGLSIVKRLVSDFEGRITVESRPEEGTVFEVRLPRGKGAPE
jgi:signal transduction histidine kinase